ncbi:hypothetical protein IV203_015061 [Nitzschia inconspicua]|uniref:Uncharacterized protein n=1 Tax=Nitzschia inconspicua TaxID=303405 RepID=A0A9K3LAH4_9STRA|nr:hypothetical protein IV203_015061 [Nitzschia inconspicua]
MGKFLRDNDGNLVNINGGLVLEKILDRKPRDCEECRFHKWVKKDKIFIIQRNAFGGAIPNKGSPFGSGAGGGGMEWICPDCALIRGLPAEHYHKNFYATPTPDVLRILHNYQLERSSKPTRNMVGGGGCEAGWSLFDMTGFICSSGGNGG